MCALTSPGVRNAGAATSGGRRWFERKGTGADRWITGFSSVLTGFFLIFSIVLGLSLGTHLAERVSIILAASIIALTSAALGVLLGFTFAIPRALQATNIDPQSKYARYISNTNFEQISDWLTKILVGVSLVEIGNLRPALGALAGNLAPMLGSTQASGGFGVAICLAAAVAAFLLGYIWTSVTMRQFLETNAAESAIRETKAVVGSVYEKALREHLGDASMAHKIMQSAQSELEQTQLM